MSVIPLPPDPPIQQTCCLAVRAAAAAVIALPVGFDPGILALIFSALFPILQNLITGCIPQPAPTPAQYRSFVASRYRRGQYGHALLRHTHREMVEQCAAEGLAANDADIETMVISWLDSVRTGSDHEITEAMQLRAAA